MMREQFERALDCISGKSIKEQLSAKDAEIERLRAALKDRTDERNYLSRQLNKAEGI